MVWLGVALAGSVLLFIPGLLEQFETPKIELLRACGLGALVHSLIAGRAGRPARWSLLDRAVVGWLAVEILATVFSVAPLVSVVGETRQREGLLTSVALVGLYFAAREAFARPGRMGATLDLVLGLAGLVGVYAVGQVMGWDPLEWRRTATYAGGYVRPFATLGHPNVLGLLAAAAAAIGLARVAAGGRGFARGPRGAAAALLILVTLLTLSRAAWLGLGAGLLVGLALALRGRGGVTLSPRVIGIALAGVAAVAAIVVLTGAGDRIARRFAELLSGGGSGGSRLEIWRAALAAWRDRPLLGHGPDLFEMVYPRFQTPAYWRFEWTGHPFHAHSIYLHTLATRGVIGALAALAWAVALGAAARSAWGRRAALVPPGVVPAAVGVLVTCAVAGAFGALGITGALLVVVMSAAVATAAEGEAPTPAAVERGSGGARRDVSRGGRGKPRGTDRRRAPAGARRWAARVVATMVATITFVWGFAELRASRAGSAAQAFMTRDPARAVRASSVAVTLAPHDDRLWRMHAQTLLWLTTLDPAPADALTEAEAAARRAVRLAPERAENRIILARALATREAGGDTTARAPAEAEFRRGFALAPMDGLALIEYADHEALLGRPATAIAAARRAAALYPDEGDVGASLARAWLAAGERDSARAALARAVRGAWRDPEARREAERRLGGLQGGAPVGR